MVATKGETCTFVTSDSWVCRIFVFLSSPAERWQDTRLESIHDFDGGSEYAKMFDYMEHVEVAASHMLHRLPTAIRPISL